MFNPDQWIYLLHFYSTKRREIIEQLFDLYIYIYGKVEEKFMKNKKNNEAVSSSVVKEQKKRTLQKK